MKNQPENCERCGAKLNIDGEPCYQRDCSYYKETEDSNDDDSGSDGFDSSDGYDSYDDSSSGDSDGMLERYFDRKSEERRQEKEEEEDGIDIDLDLDLSKNATISTSDNDNDSSDSDGGGFLDDIGEGCISGFFKLIWKIITLPFRILFKLFEIFD